MQDNRKPKIWLKQVTDINYWRTLITSYTACHVDGLSNRGWKFWMVGTRGVWPSEARDGGVQEWEYMYYFNVPSAV